MNNAAPQHVRSIDHTPASLSDRHADALLPLVFPQGLTCEQARAHIGRVLDALLALPAEQQLQFPVKHTFTDGMYMRELFIPAGSLLVGKIHRKACLNIVAAGDISLLTERGAQRVQAGFTGASTPGVQKLGFAHADTLFINVFRTDEAPIDEVERAIACEHLEQLGDLPCL